jgi:hypothetical protein
MKSKRVFFSPPKPWLNPHLLPVSEKRIRKALECSTKAGGGARSAFRQSRWQGQVQPTLRFLSDQGFSWPGFGMSPRCNPGCSLIWGSTV